MAYSKRRKSYGDGSITPLKDKDGNVVPNAYVVQVSGTDKETGKRIRPTRTVYGTKADARMKRDELKRLVKGDDSETAPIDALTGQIEALRMQLDEERRRGLAADAETLTVETWVTAWIDRRDASGQLAKSTASNYRNYIGKWINPIIGSKLMCELNPEAIEQWHVDMRNEGATPRSAQAAHKVLKQALKMAVRDRKILSNPCDVVETPKCEAEKRGYLDPSELVRMLDVLDNMEESPLTMAIRLGISTGARRGEILALNWRCVDFDKCTVRIEEALDQVDGSKDKGIASKETKAPKTKSGNRTITVDLPTMERLKNWKSVQRLKLASMELRQDPTTPVCASLYKARIDGVRKYAGAYLDPSDFSKKFAEFCAQNNFYSSRGKRLCFHELRHTQATVLISSGNDVVNVAERMGHYKPSITTDMYADAMPQKDRECADVMERFTNPSKRPKKADIRRVS